MRSVFRLFSDSARVSNSSGFDSCVRSPVWSTNEGGVASALTLAMASRKRRRDVRVRGLIEADMAVADLHEAQVALELPTFCCSTSLRANDFKTPPCSTTKGARSRPSHAFQESATIHSVVDRDSFQCISTFAFLRCASCVWPDGPLRCVHLSRPAMPAEYSRTST